MSKDGTIDQDFANLPPEVTADIEASQGVGLHHAPDHDRSAEAIAGEAEVEMAAGQFRHPEHDVAGTTWEPDWEPLDTYVDGTVVMLDCVSACNWGPPDSVIGFQRGTTILGHLRS